MSFLFLSEDEFRFITVNLITFLQQITNTNLNNLIAGRLLRIFPIILKFPVFFNPLFFIKKADFDKLNPLIFTSESRQIYKIVSLYKFQQPESRFNEISPDYLSVHVL